ncbi:uncharacterized protein LOC100373817 [Saccoglossus kowalevskii]|uniref:Uncharacterized protein LOC100373817 n=1 Tax=Saccoglossus kowalevskii TaxID=10224 RepID=A0ABM0GSF9_SACKO|nr:PREDICTED: uncharacterized protein LOC100373817 [Saccoglossus kowalevskii]
MNVNAQLSVNCIVVLYAVTLCPNSVDSWNCVHVGQIGTLTCHVEKPPNATFVSTRWQKNDQFIAQRVHEQIKYIDSTRYSFHDENSLMIKEVRREDEDVYNCSVSYIDGASGRVYQRRQLQLVVCVLYSMSLDYEITKLNSSRDGTLTIFSNTAFHVTCHVDLVRPGSTIAWYHGDSKLTDDVDFTSHDNKDVINMSSTLRFASLQKNHSGIYCCRAQDPEMIHFQDMNITILVKDSQEKFTSQSSVMTTNKTATITNNTTVIIMQQMIKGNTNVITIAVSVVAVLVIILIVGVICVYNYRRPKQTHASIKTSRGRGDYANHQYKEFDDYDVTSV